VQSAHVILSVQDNPALIRGLIAKELKWQIKEEKEEPGTQIKCILCILMFFIWYLNT
jgi:hypothetical protein